MWLLDAVSIFIFALHLYPRWDGTINYGSQTQSFSNEEWSFDATQQDLQWFTKVDMVDIMYLLQVKHGMRPLF